MILICKAADEAEIRLRLAPTADIEGGIGPVQLGTGVYSADGRVAWAHGWSEIDVAWMEIRAGSLGQMVPELPGDWVGMPISG